MENVALAQSSPCQAQTLRWADHWILELPLSALLGVWSLPLVSKEVQHSVPLVPHLSHVKQLSLCTSQSTQSLLEVNPT